MLGEIKKGLLTGFGAVFLTKEKIEDVSLRLVKEAKLSPEDAQRLKEELLTTGELQFKELENFFLKTVRGGLDNLDIASQSDLEEVKARVEKLEQTILDIAKRVPEKEES